MTLKQEIKPIKTTKVTPVRCDFDPEIMPRGRQFINEKTSSVSPACRKRRLNGAVSRNNCIKRVACRCLDGHVEEPYEISMAWDTDRRSNFFFIPPAHLCAVTYMTEIPLIVTLNNQFNSYQHVMQRALLVNEFSQGGVWFEFDWLFNVTCNDILRGSS